MDCRIENFVNKAQNSFYDYVVFSSFVNDSEFFASQNRDLFSEESRIKYEKIWFELEIINALMLDKSETSNMETCRKIWEKEFRKDAEKNCLRLFL